MMAMPQPPTSEEQAKWMREHRRSDEARALEYAGDLSSATEIYEELIANGARFSVAYQRLAIIYRKAKCWADEERVVRAAIARFGGNSGSWFVLRLAKILGERRKRG